MKQTEALKGMYDDLSKSKATTIVQQADKFFETQAQFNKWLKELTDDEAEHIKDMLVMFYEEVGNAPIIECYELVDINDKSQTMPKDANCYLELDNGEIRHFFDDTIPGTVATHWLRKTTAIKIN